jgi:hypothetical protein
VGGQGLLAAGPGFEKPIQLAFHQLECLFAAQHQSFHSVPTQVESVGVAEYVAKFHLFLYPTSQMGGQDGISISGGFGHAIRQFLVP